MPDGIHFSLEKMVRASRTREAGSLLENSCPRMLTELFETEALQSLANCVRECVFVGKMAFVQCGSSYEVSETRCFAKAENLCYV